MQESAGKALEEMDCLFSPGRSVWVFLDPEATKVGALFDPDTLAEKRIEEVAHGEVIEHAGRL